MALEDTKYTEADIIALKSAMATGAESVTTSDGKSVKLRSLAQQRSLLADMKHDVYGTKRRSGLRTQTVATVIGDCE